MNKIYKNGRLQDVSPDDVVFFEAQDEIYWSQPYNALVDNEVRKKYPLSDELAILRQKDEKPQEYTDYFAYCEQCKAYVKEQMAKYQ